jgi:L-asparagine transporter-like permease
MNLAIKISLLSSGLFLLAGMLIGIVKHQRMLSSPEHTAPAYIDIAHRAAFLYSFAMLVIAKLLEYSPYSETVQLVATGSILVFLTVTIFGYFSHGVINKTDNLFRERSFSTTWYVYMLTAGEIGGLSVILWGYISTQILGAN